MPTPNMGLDFPTLGGDPGVWDDKINAAGTVIDGHTHKAGSGVLIESDATHFDTELLFYSSAGIDGVGYSRFAAVATSVVAAKARCVFVNSADNELYYRTSGGTNIKITSGTGLNMSLVGGIYGDYAATSAKIYYEDAGKQYKMLQSGPSPDFWASVAAGDVDLYQKASGIANRVRLSSPAALAASYALTFPAAVPASTVAVQASAAGVLSFSNTFSTLITASAGVTAAAGQHFTVSGAGEYKHGDRELTFGGCAGGATGGVNPTWTHNQFTSISNAAGAIFYPIPLIVGDRIKSITITRRGDSAVDFTTISVDRYTATGGLTNLGNTSLTNPNATYADTTIDLADTVLATGQVFTFGVDVNAANAEIGNIRVVYDHP